MTCNKSFDAHITHAFSRTHTPFPRADIASISRRNNAGISSRHAATRLLIREKNYKYKRQPGRTARIWLRAYAERPTIITLHHEDSHGNLPFATHRAVLIKQYRLIRNLIVNSQFAFARSQRSRSFCPTLPIAIYLCERNNKCSAKTDPETRRKYFLRSSYMLIHIREHFMFQ